MRIGNKGIVIKSTSFVLMIILAVTSCGLEVRAELSSLGDVNASIEALGYGITGQPSDAGDLIIGDTDVGGIFIDVAFDPGPLITSSGVLGNEDGSDGVISIDGFPSDWLIGDSGTTVDSAFDLIVGNEGSGTIDLFDSAKVQVGDNTFTEGTSPSSATTSEIVAGTGVTVLGLEATGYGEIGITSVATRFVTASLIVGDAGVGNIAVQSRGKLYSADAILGNQGNSIGTVTLSGLGTRWTVGDTTTSATLTIGNGDGSSASAHGILNISTDALVQTTGVVTVNAVGRIDFSGGRLRDVGGNAIVNNGIISGDGFIDGGILIGPLGELRNAAGLANERENLLISGAVTNNGTIQSLGGAMEFEVLVTNTLEIIARDAEMHFRGGVDNTGTISIGGDTTLHGDITSTSGGSIFVLSDSESLLVGDLTFSGGSILGLSIGPDAGTLDVTGMADLAGAILSLDYSAGIASQPGDSYQIFQANGGISGTFPSIAAADGRLWDIDLVGTDTLIATATGIIALPIGADFNGDGVVNELDLIIWENNYPIASGAPKFLGDADGDGDVDAADFMKLQRDFGIIPVPPITAVPEPSTMALALLTLVCCPRRRRRS